MNRIFILILAVLVFLAAAVALFIWLSLPSGSTTELPSTQQGFTDSRPPISSQGSEQDISAVRSAYGSALSENNFDNVKIYETVVVGNYALQNWRGDNMGGEALLERNSTTREWQIISPGGGAWSVDGLVEFGVPRSTAVSLVQGMGR